MKLLILQLLLLVLQTSARDLHGDVAFDGCSDSDKESMYGLDGDVAFYADFDKKQMVYTLPEFADPITCPTCYDGAVGEQATCQYNLGIRKAAMKDFPLEFDPPRVHLLYPRDHLKPSVSNTLVCQASGFYPAPVVFSWTTDGLNTSSFSVSQAYPQSDGTFTQFSRLQVLPQDGQVYSCSLEHPALKGEKMTRLWTVDIQKPSLAPSVFCAVGLTLGLVGVAVGTFFLVKGNECR